MIKNDIEVRSLPFSLVGDGDESSLTINGLVNGAGDISQILTTNSGKDFQETILGGVFQDAINRALVSGGRIDFLYEHQPSQILATTENGSLSLDENEDGLTMSAQVSPTSWGKDAYQLIADGIIKGMSFGMIVQSADWIMQDNGLPLRIITAIDLFEVSAVRNPAYLSSDVEARGLNANNNIEIPLLEREGDMTKEFRAISKEEKEELQSKLGSLVNTVNDVTKQVTEDKPIKEAEPVTEEPTAETGEKVEEPKTEEPEEAKVEEPASHEEPEEGETGEERSLESKGATALGMQETLNELGSVVRLLAEIVSDMIEVSSEDEPATPEEPEEDEEKRSLDSALDFFAEKNNK